MTYQELAEQIGDENAYILMERHAHHEAGLVLMCEPYQSHPHTVGPMRNTIHQPMAGDTFADFLARMKVIEEEFMSGTRKRIYEHE